MDITFIFPLSCETANLVFLKLFLSQKNHKSNSIFLIVIPKNNRYSKHQNRIVDVHKFIRYIKFNFSIFPVIESWNLKNRIR